MNRALPALHIGRAHWQEIVDHLRRVYPEEGCGLLAGQSGRSRAVLPVANQLHSPHQFYMEPLELLQALETIDLRGWELLAIFHSHMAGPGAPSRQDVENYYYPDTPALICFPVQPGQPENTWECRAYRIHGDTYTEIEIQIEG